MKEMNLFLSCLILLFFSQQGQAGVANSGLDYLVKAGGQTYPLGGLLTAQAGYGIKLWEGDAPAEGPQWKYGYIRPNIELATGGTVNRGSAGISVFPVSILGITAGSGFSQRALTYVQDFDCAQVMCNEVLTYQYLQAHLMGGFKNYLFSVMGKYEKFQGSDKTLPFYEEMSYLVARPDHDDLRTLTVLAGYKFSDRWMAGVHGIYQEFILSQNNSSSLFAVGNYTEGFWQGTVGLGHYKSSHQDSRLSMIVSVSYNGLKGIGLFD